MDFEYSVKYSQTWSGGIQYELLPATMVDVFYMGTWTLGADNATVHNVPEPGPGPIQSRRPIPAIEPHQRYPVRRQVDLPRGDLQGRAPACRTTSRTTSATRSRIRRTMPRAPGQLSPRRTSRRMFATSSTRPANGRSPASTIGISSSPAASIRSRSSAGAGGVAEAALAGWRANAILIVQSRGAVHGQPQR